MKIKRYLTCAASDAKSLDEQVNESIEQGYQPYGSPYLIAQPVEGVSDTFLMVQAMTIDEETYKENRENADHRASTLFRQMREACVD